MEEPNCKNIANGLHWLLTVGHPELISFEND